MSTNAVSRRNALSGAATIGLGLPLLAACGGDDGGTATATDPRESPSSSAPEQRAPTSTPTTQESAPPRGIATTSDVPVGAASSSVTARS